MKNTKIFLLKLQEIDTRLQDLKKHRGDLPLDIEELNQNLQEKEEFSLACEGAIKQLISDRKMFEMDLEENKERLKKFEDQLYEVTNNKEYDQIQLEIETRKMEIGEFENKILKTMEEEEKLKEEAEAAAVELGSLQEDKKEKDKELNDIEQFVRDEEARLKTEREVLLKEIDKKYISRYERIKKAKSGLAVARISERGACSGCFSVIPPQRIVEIRSKDQLFSCEHCGRILIWDETLEA
ncbi:MAG: hypothetical protein KAR38_11125 [Calditrichia bacterium]|nr:hypothetical protein [Calditrichia bacterium]